jgi:hypothetical protein
MKVRVWVSLSGMVGCHREKIIELEDDTPGSEIDEQAHEVMHELVEWSWEQTGEGDE